MDEINVWVGFKVALKKCVLLRIFLAVTEGFLQP